MRYLSDLSVVTPFEVIVALKEDVAKNGLAEGVVLIVEVVEALERVVGLKNTWESMTENEQYSQIVSHISITPLSLRGRLVSMR